MNSKFISLFWQTTYIIKIIFSFRTILLHIKIKSNLIYIGLNSDHVKFDSLTDYN